MKKFLVACITVFMTLMLTSCNVISVISSIIDMLTMPEISLEYTLTQKDLTEFNQLVDECEEIAMEGENVLSLTLKLSALMEKLNYIDAQSNVGYLEYCQDQKDPTALAHYQESEGIMAAARLKYLAMLKKLATESPIKDELFEGWSEEEMAMLLVDNELVSTLQMENNELTRQFYDLEEDEKWSASVSDLYVQLVENNQEIAEAYGYDNYYEFASEQAYGRAYTAAQRNSFRGFVGTYVLPLFKDVYEEYSTSYAALTDAQKLELEALYGNYEYMDGYIDSYKGSVNQKMNAMFDRTNAAIFANGENALEGAFVTYISYFEQPIAYFGPGYQDVLTLVHEMGHYVSLHHFDQSILPYDLAETHSQGNEWMFMAYLEGEGIDPVVYETLYLEKALDGLLTIIYSTVVDHFEELVYTAETPIKADGYQAVMASVCAQYKDIEETLGTIAKYTPFEYAQHVTITSPVYYLNYATSGIASMGFYVIAQQEGYASAQAAFTLLQEGVAIDADFLTAIKAAGLPSPLVAKTYTDLRTALLG